MNAKALFEKAYGLEKKNRLYPALGTYKQVIDHFPDTAEAEYARKQIEKVTRIIESKGGVHKRYSGREIKALLASFSKTI